MDFFNNLEFGKSVIGNHELYYYIIFLNSYMNKSNFDYIIDNTRNKTINDHITFNNQKKYDNKSRSRK